MREIIKYAREGWGGLTGRDPFSDVREGDGGTEI